MQFSQIYKRQEKSRLKDPLWSFHENVEPELRLRCLRLRLQYSYKSHGFESQISVVLNIDLCSEFISHGNCFYYYFLQWYLLVSLDVQDGWAIQCRKLLLDQSCIFFFFLIQVSRLFKMVTRILSRITAFYNPMAKHTIP